ncbi:hypothetical protein ACVWXP_007456 [Bradyrhizobium sp. USDA 4463]
MRSRIIGRLIGVAVIEFVIGVSWLFGANQMLVLMLIHVGLSPVRVMARVDAYETLWSSRLRCGHSLSSKPRSR